MGGSNPVTLMPVPDAQNDGVLASAINVTAPNATVVGAVAGKRIFVHGLMLDAAGTATVTPNDLGASATVAQTGPLVLIAGTPLVLPWQNYPWMTVQAGNALVFTGNAASVQISGRVLYVPG